MHALALHGVFAGYGKTTVLHDLELTVGPGFHTVLGPNGAGKTTLFRVAAGVLVPRSGSVTIFGQDPHQQPNVKREVAYITHRPGLAREITVHENLEFWARVLAFTRADFATQLERLTNQLQLQDILHSPVRKLSRGQAQRASIARALLSNPRIVLCDEPTTGLDPIAAAQLRWLLASLAASGRAVLYSTHNLYEAAELSDDVLLLVGGRIQDRGTVRSLASRLVERRRYGIRVDRDPSMTLSRLGRAA